MPLIKFAFVLSFVLIVAVCSGERVGDLSIWWDGSESCSDEERGIAIHCGGYRRVGGKPLLMYGSVVEKGQRRYTYLVIGPRQQAAFDEAFNKHEETHLESDGGSSIQIAEECGVSLSMAFQAETSPGTGAIKNAVLAINGVEQTSEDQWLFLFDWRSEQSEPLPIKVDMPRLPRNKSELRTFTEEFIDGLIAANPIVAEFVDR